MEGLFRRFAYEVEKARKGLNADDYFDIDPLCKKYGTFVKIHIKNSNDCGDIFTNEEFALAVEHGSIDCNDGIGRYVGTDLIETSESVDFKSSVIRSKVKEYPYVFWYNK